MGHQKLIMWNNLVWSGVCFCSSVHWLEIRCLWQNCIMLLQKTAAVRDSPWQCAAAAHFPPVLCAPCGFTCHPGTFSWREKQSWASPGVSQIVSAQCRGEMIPKPRLARTRNFPPLTLNEWFLFCWKLVMEFLHSVPWIRLFPVIVSYLSPRSMKRNKNIWNRGVFDSLPWKCFS